jgi:serine/threonine protein kinase
MYIHPILGELDHPNIMQAYGTYLFKKSFYFTTEYFEGGDLYNRLAKKETFCELECANCN